MLRHWLRDRESPLDGLTMSLQQRVGELPAITSLGEEPLFLDPVVILGQGRLTATITVGSHCDLAGVWAVQEASSVLSIGSRTEISPGCIIDVLGRVEIGDDVMIGDAYIADHDNHSSDWDVRKHDHFARRRGERDWSVVPQAPIAIESKVWIGRRTTILKGVTIGEGAIVATGSLVTKPVRPWSVVAGVPAVEIRALDRPATSRV